MTRTIDAEICLYGNHDIGAGWLARIDKDRRMFGDGEPCEGRSFTEAVYMAAGTLVANGCKGYAMIYDPTGRRQARVRLGGHIGYYGDLPWEPARQWQIDLDQLMAAAE